MKPGLAAVDNATGETSKLSEVLGDTVLGEIEREPVDVIYLADRRGKMNLVIGDSVEPCTGEKQKSTKKRPLCAEFQRAGRGQQHIGVLRARSGMVAYSMPGKLQGRSFGPEPCFPCSSPLAADLRSGHR